MGCKPLLGTGLRLLAWQKNSGLGHVDAGITNCLIAHTGAAAYDKESRRTGQVIKQL